MSKFKKWKLRNDVGLGSIVAFFVVPFVSAFIAALDKAGVAWWTLTPDQLWALGKAAFLSVVVGLVGRYGQAIADKWGPTTLVDPPVLDFDAPDIGDADPVDTVGNPLIHPSPPVEG